MVTDNDPCWKTEDVRSHIAHHHITQLFYASYLGARLDPCDNSFHASFRRRYDESVLREVNVDLSRRLQLLNEAYHATPTDAVLGCIRRCGLFEGDPEHVMAELLQEGQRRTCNMIAKEKRYIAAYLQFQEDTN